MFLKNKFLIFKIILNLKEKVIIFIIKKKFQILYKNNNIKLFINNI